MKNRIENSITLVIGSNIDEVVSENKKHISRFVKSKKLQNNEYRVLIVDFKGKYKGTKINTEDLSNFKNKTCIVGNSKMSNLKKLKLLEIICRNYKNGLLIIDDFHEIKKDVEFNSFMGILAMLSTNRNPQRDCIFHFGDNINNIPFMLFRNSDYIRLHNFKNFENRLVFNIELFKIANSIFFKGLSYNYNHIVLDIHENKIFGLPERDYISGVVNYIYMKLCDVRNSKQLDDFSKMKFNTNYFSTLKHIPISNINRTYK